MLMAKTPDPIHYPDRDGKPMAENTRQFRWITILAGNLAALFRDRDDVFVSGDQLWYPVEGFPEIRQAPDVYVVFGRPKGDRGSWKQWEEGDVPMTVVFEILSPGNTVREMIDKFAFDDEYGVEEYDIYDPDNNKLDIYQRGLASLRRVPDVAAFVSPRLGIRFHLTTPEMTVLGPEGRPFLTFENWKRNASARSNAPRRPSKIARMPRCALDGAEQRADKAEQRIVRLAELSRKARRGQASEAELQELELLEQPLPQ